MHNLQLPKITFWRIIFIAIVGAGLYSAFVRFYYGLGAATHLSDQFPWGMWIGVDVLCGVGLAAGGFIIASSVYIFNLEEYRSILRPAVLTAFLGYLLVVFALMFDLGKPWNIWHPIVMWNPHSVMFEVGWCVMLYTTVLALEFSPIIFERFKLHGLNRIIHAATIPLVILGVILSSLHQSSLGSLFLIVPSKVHPLWYSSNLPYLFFASAVAVGPAMVTIESYYSSRTFKREIEIHILSKLGKVSAAALAVYLVLKIEDVIGWNLWNQVFSVSYESMMYWAEILIGVLIPITLLVQPRIRASVKGVFTSSLFVVFGFMLNRLNISMTALERYSNANYFPHWMELSITLMVVAIGFVVFRYAVMYLPIFASEAHVPSRTEPQRENADIVEFIDLPASTQS